MRFLSGGSLFRRLVLLSVLALLLSASSLLFAQHAYARVQDAPELYAADFYQYNYYNKSASFVGVNFTPNSSITLIWRIDSVADLPAGTITSNASGGFTFKVANMPSLPCKCQTLNQGGTFIGQSQGTLIATDAQNLQASFLVAETPLVTANPQTATIGDTVTVSGGGYGPNETVNILIAHGDTDIPFTTATADAQGAFNSTFVIPNTISLTDALRLVGATTGINLYPTDFGFHQQLQISPDHGPVGTSVTVTGALYDPSNTEVPLYWVDAVTHKKTTLISLSPASDGTFQTQVTVPANATAGLTYKISAARGTANFTVTN